MPASKSLWLHRVLVLLVAFNYRMAMPADDAIENGLYYTAKHAAYLIGVSRRALYQFTEPGRLENPPPFKRVGGRIMFPKAEYDAWAEQKVIR